MSRLFLTSYVLVICLILSACGGGSVTRPTAIFNAERYINEGLQAFGDDDWSRAQQLFNRALQLYQGLDNQQGILVSHINLAEAALSLHEYSLSQTHLDKASYIVQKTSFTDFQSRISLLYSLTALKQKKITQAKNMIQALLPEFDGETIVLMPDNNQLIAIAQRTKISFVQQRDELLWVNRYARALSISAIKDHALDARLLRFQAILQQRQGDYLQAEAKLQQALFVYKGIPSRLGIAMTLTELGELAFRESRWQDANDYFSRAMIVFAYLKEFTKVSQLAKKLEQVTRALAEL